MSAWLKGDKCTLIMQHDDWMPSNKRAVMTQRATFLVGSCNVATLQMNTSCTTDRRLYVYSNDLYGWQSSVIPHYASAVLLSVCLSHVGVLSKRLRGASWFCWHKNFLQPILHYVMAKFGYLQKVRILPSATLSRTLNSKNFSMASQSSQRVVNLARQLATVDG